jgi:diacylglycerol kinase family enzyme
MTTMTRAMSRTDSGPATGARSIQIVATLSSGHGGGARTVRRLHDALRARGHGVALEVFSDLTSLRRWATSEGTRSSLLISVGGDGTQSTAAIAAVRRSIPFLSVPSGFGNLFARAFGHVPDVDRVVDLLDHGTLVDADVGVRNGQLFLDQESFGVLSQIQASVEARLTRPSARWRRWLAYYRGAVRYLRDTPLTMLRVAVDGRIVADDAVLVTVANVETYGPWLTLTPAASPVDGLFDVFVMRGATKLEALAKLLRRHLRLPAAEQGSLFCRGRRVSVAASRSTRDELEVIPGLLPVVVSMEMATRLDRQVPPAARPLEIGHPRVA